MADDIKISGVLRRDERGARRRGADRTTKGREEVPERAKEEMHVRGPCTRKKRGQSTMSSNATKGAEP